MIKLIAVCGKSASGKDSIVSNILETYPNEFHRKISHTTRAIRNGEIDGVDYFFKTNQEMFNLLADEKMFEATEFNGEFYGTGIEGLNKDKINIGMFDPFGIETLVNEKDIQLLIIYVKVDDKTRLMRSLQRENNLTIEEIYKRYEVDKKAFEDFETKYEKDIVVINNRDGNLDQATKLIYIMSNQILK